MGGRDSQRLRSILASLQFMSALKMVHTTYKIANPSNTYFAICSIPQNSFLSVHLAGGIAARSITERPGGSRGTTGVLKVKKCSFSLSIPRHNTMFWALDEKISQPTVMALTTRPQ